MEAEQQARVVYSIPHPETMLAQWCRGNGVLRGTYVSAFREGVKKHDRGLIKKHMHEGGHAFVCECVHKPGKQPLRLLFLKQCVS